MYVVFCIFELLFITRFCLYLPSLLFCSLFCYCSSCQWRKFSSGGGGAKLANFRRICFDFSYFFCFFNKYEQARPKMATMLYATYQKNIFKKIKSTFSTYELPHAPVNFSINLGIFNCFENSDRAENFRQTVPIYGFSATDSCYTNSVTLYNVLTFFHIVVREMPCTGRSPHFSFLKHCFLVNYFYIHIYNFSNKIVKLKNEIKPN